MKSKIYKLLVLVFLITSCRKSEDIAIKDEDNNIPVEKPFNVSTGDKQTFKVGERVTFLMEGNPESINFYSGDKGFEYEYRNGRPLPSGISLSLSTYTNKASYDGHISILLSTDFDGNLSSLQTVKAGNWIDVTNKFILTSKLTTWTPTGTIDLSDYTQLNKPIYFAIKYTNKFVDGAPATWYVRDLKWYSVLSNSSELIGQMTTTVNTLGLRVVHQDPTKLPTMTNNIGTVISDRFFITGNVNSQNAESWFVSSKFDGIQEMIGAFSKYVPIKSAGNSMLKSYSHTYTSPGEYNVYFIATVLQDDGSRIEEIKSIKINIES